MNILTKAFAGFVSKKTATNVCKSDFNLFEKTMILANNDLNVTENPIVYRCIKLIAQNIGSVPIRIEDGEQSFWQNIIDKPNPTQKMNSLVQQMVSDMLIHGNAYLLCLQGAFAIYRIDPKAISTMTDDLGNAIGYIYQTQKGSKKVLTRPDGSCEILNIKYVNASGENLSPCKVVRKSVKLYNSITQYNQALMDNMANFSGALVIKGNMNEHQLNLLRAEIDAKKGPEKAGHTAILYGSTDMDVRWEAMKANVREADYIEGQNFVAREIMQVFGVPPNLLGMSDISYNNYEQARIYFWEDTLRPLSIYIIDALQDWLSANFGLPLRLSPDFGCIPAFADKTCNLLKILGPDCLSHEEKRKYLGFKSD